MHLTKFFKLSGCLICFLFLFSCTRKGENNYQAFLQALKTGDIQIASLHLDSLSTKNPAFHHVDTTISFLERIINTQATQSMRSILNKLEADSSFPDTSRRLSSKPVIDSLNLAKYKHMIALHEDNINTSLADSIIFAYNTLISQKYKSFKIAMEKKEEKEAEELIKIKPLFIGTFSKNGIDPLSASSDLPDGNTIETYIISSNGTYKYRFYETVVNHPRLNGTTNEKKGLWKCNILDTSIVFICKQKKEVGSEWEECADSTTFALDKFKEEYRKSR